MTILGTPLDAVRAWAVGTVSAGWATAAVAFDLPIVDQAIDKGVTWLLGALFCLSLAATVKLLNDRDKAYRDRISKLEAELNVERAKGK